MIIRRQENQRQLFRVWSTLSSMVRRIINFKVLTSKPIVWHLNAPPSLGTWLKLNNMLLVGLDQLHTHIIDWIELVSQSISGAWAGTTWGHPWVVVRFVEWLLALVIVLWMVYFLDQIHLLHYTLCTYFTARQSKYLSCMKPHFVDPLKHYQSSDPYQIKLAQPSSAFCAETAKYKRPVPDRLNSSPFLTSLYPC